MYTCGTSSYHETTQVFKIYTKYLSCLVYTEVYNLFVCNLCPHLTSFHNEIPARTTCHVSRERAVLDLIAFRKHDTQRLFLISAKKKSISNLYVIGIPLNEQTISIFFLPCSFTDLRLGPERV